MQRPRLDFWFDFGSTYSYPAALRIQGLAQAAGIEVRYRPFMLGAVFKAQGWETSPFNIYPAKGRYMWRDLERLCHDLGLPLVRPIRFRRTASWRRESPWRGRVKPWIADFCTAVFRAEFGEGRQIAETAVIRDILEALGVAADPLLGSSQIVEIKARLRERNGGSAAPRHFRFADVRHRGRRAVLGQRSPGGCPRVGTPRTEF